VLAVALLKLEGDIASLAKEELGYELRRIKLIYIAISMAVLAALLVAALISLAFIDPFVQLDFNKLIAILFIVFDLEAAFLFPWAVSLGVTKFAGWVAMMIFLAELGFGLDLSRCAVTGDNDSLVAVSPRSGRAVSAAEAEPYGDRLLALPQFLREGGPASWSDIIDGLRLTGHFLMRDLLTDRAAPMHDARDRLVDRLRRAAGVA